MSPVWLSYGWGATPSGLQRRVEISIPASCTDNSSGQRFRIGIGAMAMSAKRYDSPIRNHHAPSRHAFRLPEAYWHSLRTKISSRFLSRNSANARHGTIGVRDDRRVIHSVPQLLPVSAATCRLPGSSVRAEKTVRSFSPRVIPMEPSP